MCYDRIENLTFIVVSLSMIIYGTVWFLVEEGEGVRGGMTVLPHMAPKRMNIILASCRHTYMHLAIRYLLLQNMASQYYLVNSTKTHDIYGQVENTPLV